MRLHLTAASLALAAAIPPAYGAQTNAPAADRTPLKVTEIAGGLENAWSMQELPDGRILVTERTGQLRIVTVEGRVSDPITGLPEMATNGQGGLLDVLLAGDFATTGTIYFSYSEPRGPMSNGTSVMRATLKFAGSSGSLENGKVIFRQQPAASGSHHFGSRLVFDKTGALFVTTGERNILRDSAQDVSTHIGKVIRILPDGSVPKDNPFVGKTGAAPEVWSYGHRNLQGAALDPTTGKLWTTEHGPQGGDELNQPQAGKNYGWPIITYGIDYSGAPIGDGISEKAGMEQPVYYWKPSIATSGLAFYTGELFPGWKGNLLAGGLKANVLERLILKDDEVVAVEPLLTDLKQRIRDVRVAADGSVLVLTDDANGKLLRLTPGASASP
ncbi:MAG: PQQ-dependent sugar dehydrogenase [Hyphomicrobium sp.]|nr:PQQ-dependent sugar dehydrogenase [Hyphomicrobium sp.]